MSVICWPTITVFRTPQVRTFASHISRTSLLNLGLLHLTQPRMLEVSIIGASEYMHLLQVTALYLESNTAQYGVLQMPAGVGHDSSVMHVRGASHILVGTYHFCGQRSNDCLLRLDHMNMRLPLCTLHCFSIKHGAIAAMQSIALT